MSADARTQILTRIRTALRQNGAVPMPPAALDRRMTAPPTAPLPAMEDDRVSRFIAKADANGIAVDHIASLQMLVPALARLLSETGLKADISVAPALADLDWPKDWQINFAAGRREEHLSVTFAAAGIAETGSLVFRSGAGSPATLNFLPDIHVIVLRTGDIAAYPEEVWDRFRAEGQGWPRAMNVIASPSRTADVGGIVVRPAHGPKAVHLFLLGSD
ncbi:LUD domain-containing protein [Methyloligella sp. 2.7D]|uniref:LutC/YkgG family protein n=1 Tax=unclassified Methyloligella TaxID=2625955 RepID=UPI00157BC028|nr:LUD domain-containing protein [Methyloligella sp. GL2]QKP76896.1 LUD domain-containing protein [Methyloligella sp. GL2]